MDNKLPCGCIACNNYDDCGDCKFNGDVSKGCNRLDYNQTAKRAAIREANRGK